MEATDTDWERGEHIGFVSIANHCLRVTVHGPDRRPGDPIVIVLTNVATSSGQWIPFRRLLSRRVRTMMYDRSGLGDSEEIPNPTAPTARNIALELDVLLIAAKIGPPYIIVCHSFGAIVAREFLVLKNIKVELHDIVGMVFVEGDQENTHSLLKPDENVRRMSQGQDLLRATGLYDEMVLEPERREGLYLEAEIPLYQETAAAECGEIAESSQELGEKKQLEADPPLLGSVPVSVVLGDTARDHERIYEAGLRQGKEGIPLAAWQRRMAEYRELDEMLQLANLNLSTTGSVAIAQNSGHNVHLTEPEVIVKEVQWILDVFNNSESDEVSG
ncbi:hypothetical protein RJZ56_007341 [Blastomyces dermatitidis]|uniref:Alpha/beta hydrolase n=3 Tax=Blastomyces TaxID=229219 RepID=A0A179URV3_BLAGS|nr:alpha/beta hydrolase, variant 2 [Blastomyces gilchristii SLH14081]XP_031578996.1 alpha/beta hydrolase [Blastomyces gilchristii SLH14081]XP_031578997.1 alpha/beta hydrolase, variant 1 [Blastomyces gilchristii SLH14081]XP_045274944.1 alpha/beta hydrolase, variant 2 [Blastomyces dermatitidis ER-3]XP_045280154.1 alpha/beta hydrolase [Blastomyces dermatitidis ER-3]XP_045280155.1 alpha/beta hydrolase, variant 1 [Blastomyces dermatitidis ER-3]EGE77750.1 alpha/beta hydrolase [Blastomyces dermatiti